MDAERVVGAVIVRNGRAFVIKRSLSRRLFPGCWDLPGGHVDAGEEPLDALAREIEEETGWTLRSVVIEVTHHRWHGDDSRARAEVDYLVTVDGDLDHPRLEEDKHPEHRWVAPSDIDLLSEGRAPGDDIIKHTVDRALTLATSRPAPARRRGSPFSSSASLRPPLHLSRAPSASHVIGYADS